MYRVARIRMASIGPNDARFDRPSARLPGFELDLTARGTATDTVLWLENGGGKTVFLTLLFHVLRPDHAAQIGDEHGKRGGLDDFVHSDDVAHVQIEWHACDAGGVLTGERLITGLVAERRPRAGNPDKVDKTWYALAIRDPRFTLDNLATESEGRRIPKRVFLENLRELVKDAGRRSLDLRVADGIAKWLTALAEIGLDPALLAYQVTMNRKEGGAASLFRFTSDEKFLTFFLGLVTDPEALDAADETVTRVADKLATLPTKEREVRFAEGALPHLERVATDYQRARNAAAALGELRAKALALATRLVAAVQEAHARATTEAERARLADERATNADRRRRALDDERRLLAIALADLRVKAATSAVTDARAVEKQTALERDAWAVVPARLDVDRCDARVKALSEAFATLEQETEPLRLARDVAGCDLRRRLVADGLLLRAEARDHQDRQDEVRRAARQDQERAKQFIRDADRARGEARSLGERWEAHLADLERAFTARLLFEREVPASAVTRLEGLLAAEKRRLDGIEQERRSIRTLRPGLEEEYRKLLQSAARAEEDARAQAVRANDARTERARFTGDRRIADAAELSPHEIDLDSVGTAVVERLEARARSADGRRIDVEVRGATDRRAVASLEGGTALLPPRTEVSEVLDRIRAAGVHGANAGWRHLADAIAATRREPVFTALPALADGIVVPSGQFGRAVAALEEVSVHPPAAVVVGTIEAMEAVEATDVAPANQYVVRPAAALYDRAAAVMELEVRRARLDRIETERAVLEAEAREHRMLAMELRAHLEKWPPGTVELATTTAKVAAHRHAELVAGRDTAAERLRHLTERDLALEMEATEAQMRHQAAADALRVVGPLATDAARLHDAPATITRHHERADSLENEANQIEQRAERAQLQLQELAGRIAELGMVARTAVHDAASVMAPAHSDEKRLTAPDGEADADTVRLARSIASGPGAQALRVAFETMDRKLAAATTESQVAMDLAAARSALSGAEEKWALVPARVQQRAQAFAATPHAHDPIALDAALRAADQALEVARSRTIEANGVLELEKRTREDLPRPERVGARLELEPTDEADARGRLATTESAYLAAATERSDAEVERDLARTAAEQARQRAQLLEQQVRFLASALREPLPSSVDVAPFDGSLDAAQVAVDELTAGLHTTIAEKDAATRGWQHYANQLTAFARDDVWSGMHGAVFRRLAHDPADQLAVDAVDLVAQLGLLKDRLNAEIASMSDHRQLLVRSLAELVGAGISSLRQATTRSRLPDQLGDWSHQPFLKIDFDSPSDVEIEQRLSTYMLDLIAEPRDRRPVGSRLLTTALLKCISGGVRVHVLKPNRAMARTYVPIAEMAILSGGMRATAAIAMFCTLARLRAANRVQAREKGVATLILDNPIGDASAVYLVSLQRLVAEGAGIQLMYTTGIKDLDALRQFPNPIRLSNLSSRRAGLAYVTGDPDFLRQLWPEGDEARLTATRVHRTHAPRLIP